MNNTQQILLSWFITDMVKATYDMWLKGWDERNGGNITLRLLEEDVAPYLAAFNPQPPHITLTHDVAAVANCYFLVTGSGKYFRNVIIDPADTLAIIQIDAEGKGYYLLWGLTHGGSPTSELAAHLQSHSARLTANQRAERVIMHCHATHLIALTYVLELDTRTITRWLWEMSTECLAVFPDGVGVMPWIVPGTDEIGDATAEMMQHHRLVLWAFHGIFASGTTLDDAFGLIDTAEKAAEITTKVLTMGGQRQSITRENFIAMAKRFNVTPLSGILD